MKILFLTRLNPNNINEWSGTTYHIFNSLKRKHEVHWIGNEVIRQVATFQQFNFPHSFKTDLLRNRKVIGKLVSERIKKSEYNLVFFGDNYFVPYLNIQVPIVHLSDTTYERFREYLDIADEDQNLKSINNEKLSLEKYSSIIYSSNWAKNAAIEYYGIDEKKIKVVEFGANIPYPPTKNIIIDIKTKECKLIFIGRNWKKKGGDKVLDAYKKLKSDGFCCQLTIIGSVPVETQITDHNLRIIPFLDKSKADDIKQLEQLLRESHFLVLPTEFECFGIVFCEASAYGVPSIASNVGGVSQVIREGKNGYLLAPNATADDYATIIKTVFEDKEQYLKLRENSRKEFEERLNWDIWLEKTDKILQDILTEYHVSKVI